MIKDHVSFTFSSTFSFKNDDILSCYKLFSHCFKLMQYITSLLNLQYAVCMLMQTL